jgi:Flp pilus assembly pilin Flp
MATGSGNYDRGATSTEAGLLLGAVFLVAFPAFAVLGKYVSGGFSSACEDISRSASPDCVTVQGAAPPAILPGPLRQLAEVLVAEWVVRERPAEVAQDIACAAVPDPPPPGTSSDCDITFDDGTSMQVVVTWVDGSPDPVVEPVEA